MWETLRHVILLLVLLTTSLNGPAPAAGQGNGAPEPVTSIKVTGAAQRDRYTVTISVQHHEPGNSPEPGEPKPEPPPRPGPAPGKSSLPRTTYYSRPSEWGTIYCVRREENQRPEDYWPYWYEVCTQPLASLPAEEVAKHPNERPYMLTTSIPRYIYYSPCGGRFGVCAHVVPHARLLWAPKRFPSEKIDLRGGAITGSDPRDAALSVLANVPLPTIELKANPELGLVNLPSWFWVSGYDGRTITHSEHVFLTIPGQGPGLAAAISAMVPGGRNIGGWCVSLSCARMHHGIDVQAPMGTPVHAMAPGVITRVYVDGLGGNAVIWTDNAGRRHYNCHFDRFSSWLSPGQRIPAGHVIGYIGMTGNAQGTVPHTHWGIFGTEHDGWDDPAKVMGGYVGGVGVLVRVRVSPGEYRWEFGDGAVTQGSLGRAYPRESDVKHSYRYSSAGEPDEAFKTKLTVRFTGEYTVDDAPPRTLPPLEVYYEGRHRVQEAQSVLTSP